MKKLGPFIWEAGICFFHPLRARTHTHTHTLLSTLTRPSLCSPSLLRPPVNPVLYSLFLPDPLFSLPLLPTMTGRYLQITELITARVNRLQVDLTEWSRSPCSKLQTANIRVVFCNRVPLGGHLVKMVWHRVSFRSRCRRNVTSRHTTTVRIGSAAYSHKHLVITQLT